MIALLREAAVLVCRVYLIYGWQSGLKTRINVELPVLRRKYWQSNTGVVRYADRMERRLAEFLVKDRVPLGLFLRIGVINQDKAEEVRAILAASGISLQVDVMRDWYFLGQ